MGGHYVDEVRDGWRVARVIEVDDENNCAYLDLDNGLTGTINGWNRESVTIEPGTVVLVDSDADQLRLAPESLWRRKDNKPPTERVAVVKVVTEAETVLDEGGSWRLVPTVSAPTYQEGNTVVANARGVLRVIAEKPIRYVEPPDAASEILGRFKLKLSSSDFDYEDFGGMSEVMDRARELIEVPLEQAERLRTIGARPIKGVLFEGPPGTGKTMLAKIIAHKAEATFYKISGPEVLSKWYGESEAILRRVFQDAAEQPRAIIFFDEIDAIAGSRSENQHEASQRLVAQLLTQMDGFDAASNVIVIAATNRANAIDPALRRPGRFDWEVQFSLPAAVDRELILKAAARGLAVVSDLPHAEVAARTEGWSGADLSAIWSEAALFAAKDQRAKISKEDYLEGVVRVEQQIKQKAASR